MSGSNVIDRKSKVDKENKRAVITEVHEILMTPQQIKRTISMWESKKEQAAEAYKKCEENISELQRLLNELEEEKEILEV